MAGGSGISARRDLEATRLRRMALMRLRPSFEPLSTDCLCGRPYGARVVQLRGELVPAAHVETLFDEPEVLREGLQGAHLVPELDLVDLVGDAIARFGVLDHDLKPR